MDEPSGNSPNSNSQVIFAGRGNVLRPPPLQPILRLQHTVGNLCAQRILGIGDGTVVAIEPVSAPPVPVQRSLPARFWIRLLRRRPRA
jgi:hypothetical protein